MVGYTARTGKLCNVTDSRKCPYYCAEVDEMTGYTTKTLLCAPLIAKGRYTQMHDHYTGTKIMLSLAACMD